MCLAVPGEILAIENPATDASDKHSSVESAPHDDATPRYARVAFGGVERRVCLSLVPEAQVGDYVIVHVGFAISRLDPEQARLTLNLLNER